MKELRLRSRLRRPGGRALLFAALAAGALLPLWRHLDTRYQQEQESEYRAQVGEHALSDAAAIAAAVNRRLTLIDGLYAFVQSQLASPRFEFDLKSFSAGLYAAVPGIRAVEVIPGGVIRFVYPLAGNEAALGHDLNSDPRPEVRTDLERARKMTGHSLTGPLELRQGGLGLIARRAVFRDGRFWGFVTIVLDVRSVIREATVGPQYVSFAVRDSQNRVFHGDPAVFESDPVLERVPLPDGFWELAAVPPGGWASLPGTALLVYRALAVSLFLAVCIVVYLITERQYRLSRAVRTGQEQYRLVTESVPMLISSFDNLMRCRFANKAHESWFGHAQSEMIGRSIGEILGEEVSQKVREDSARLAGGDQVSFDAEIPAANGATRQVHATCVPQYTDDSAPDGFYLVATDITGRKQAELAVRRSEARLANAQAIAHIGSWEVDLTTMNFQCSDEACRIFDFACGEKSRLSKLEVLARVPEPDRERLDAALGAAVEKGASVDLEHRVMRPDGTERLVRLLSQVEFDGGRPVRLAGTVQDVTEYRQLEAQLRQAQKMEAIGQLAGGVAHDFNNLLSVILGYSEMALHGIPDGDPLREQIIEIREAGERATSLTRQLLAFSRRQVLQPRILDLNKIIDELQKLLRRLIGENVALVTKLDRSIGPVLVDAGQMEQVIINLAVNARDAMPDGGTLTIETAEGLIPDLPPEKPAAAAGRHVVLRIRDTGTGIAPENQARIFEPFFTTKESGKGTGLGLSTVYGIVKQSGGEITFTSARGRGTTFSIYLPVSAETAGEESAGPSMSAATRSTETVLLVEDDDGVRSFAQLLLRQLGYSVLAAPHAAEAIRMVRSHSGPVHLLLTDVIMPGMSGSELAEQLQRLRPGIKVLFMSGYVRDETVDRVMLANGVRFIQKPFTPDSLGHAIRAALDHSEDAHGA